MPTYNFSCKCGNSFDEFTTVSAERAKCPKCGKSAKKQFTPCNQFLVPLYMKAGIDNSAQARWMEEPETKAKLASGEYERAKF